MFARKICGKLYCHVVKYDTWACLVMFIDSTHYISKVLLGALVKHFRFEKIMSKRVSDIYDICYGTEVEEKGTWVWNEQLKRPSWSKNEFYIHVTLVNSIFIMLSIKL